jgi:hypothetical protein
MKNLIFALFAILLFVPASTLAQDCSEMSEVECVGSAMCTLDKPAGDSQLFCRPAYGRCEIGYRQHLSAEFFREDNAKNRCEARSNCAFKEPEQCYCPAVSGLLCDCGGGKPHQCEATAAQHPIAPQGAFEIISLRRASDVASPAPTPSSTEPLGQIITLTDARLSLAGMDCENWKISPIDLAIDPQEPNLSDLFVAPINATHSDGNALILQSWSYQCESAEHFEITQIDPRNIVMPINNSADYAIASLPLSLAETHAIQEFLADTKFYSGPINDMLSDDFYESLARWMEYRSAPWPTVRFKRTAITHNLMDRAEIFAK